VFAVGGPLSGSGREQSVESAGWSVDEDLAVGPGDLNRRVGQEFYVPSGEVEEVVVP
jgi:hypothetical protein